MGGTVAATIAAAFVGTPLIAAPLVHDGESPPAVAWRNAMEAGNVAALARMYDATSVVYPPDHRQVNGVAAIMEGYDNLFAAYTATVTVADAHWIDQSPLIVSWGVTTLTLHPRSGGADVVSRTRFTDVAISTAAGWRYLVDHASTVPVGK